MSYATLMVYVEAGDGSEHTIRLATQLADKFTAKLIGVSAMPLRPPMIVNGIVVDAVTEADIGKMMARLSEKEKWFRQIGTASHRTVDWRCEVDFPTEFFVSEARRADLLLVNPNRGLRSAYNSLDAAGAILRAGRPVLVAPAELSTLQADRVVIGWKDAREARRAVQDALPFLHDATRITIAQICEGGGEEAAHKSIDDVVGYLARHRVKAGPKVILHREGSGAAQLIRLAQQEGADLLVAGAFGHSRLGEWIFGGVTQDLLVSSPICCLMSH
jgi:nucleotide-binding universal stress UspA family protein